MAVVEGSISRFGDALDRWADRAGQWMESHWLAMLWGAWGAVIGLAALAPALASWGAASWARPIYWTFSWVCHQRPERTFWLAGHPMALCARDIGLYGGLWLGGALTAARRVQLSGKVALLCALPLILDGGTQLIGLRESTNLLRVITGLLAGVTAAAYLLSQVGVSRRPSAPVMGSERIG